MFFTRNFPLCRTVTGVTIRSESESEFESKAHGPSRVPACQWPGSARLRAPRRGDRGAPDDTAGASMAYQALCHYCADIDTDRLGRARRGAAGRGPGPSLAPGIVTRKFRFGQLKMNDSESLSVLSDEIRELADQVTSDCEFHLLFEIRFYFCFLEHLHMIQARAWSSKELPSEPPSSRPLTPTRRLLPPRRTLDACMYRDFQSAFKVLSFDFLH